MDQHQQQQQEHAPEQHYAGLDVSLDDTSVCVLDARGTVVWRGKCASTPEAIRDALNKRAPALVRAGLETGLLSNWLTHKLRGMRLPVVCLDARHAKAALKVQINKTDANDALGLAQIVRTGWYREVAVKGMDAHALRLLLVARSQLVSQRQAVANTVRGLLKAFGLKVPPGARILNRRCARRLGVVQAGAGKRPPAEQGNRFGRGERPQPNRGAPWFHANAAFGQPTSWDGASRPPGSTEVV